MDEKVYTSFETYDFENNLPFQKGWKTLSSVVNQDNIDHDYTRAKAFFFSRHVHQMDFEKYLDWKKCHKEEGSSSGPEVGMKNKQVDEGCTQSKGSSQSDHSLVLKPSQMTDSDKNGFECWENRKTDKELMKDTENTACKQSNSDSDLTSKERSKQTTDRNGENELSLMELTYYIQNNLEIPGIEKLDVKPTNSNPTPSSLVRKPKPWEVTSTKTAADEESKTEEDL